MKKNLEHPNMPCAFLLTLMIAFLLGCGCNSSKPVPDPLAGFRIYVNHDPDQAIDKDYKDYIQTLSPEEVKAAGPIFYYEDGAGHHAIKIEIGINGTSWEHVLIYNKEDKRTKTIKYVAGHFTS